MADGAGATAIPTQHLFAGPPVDGREVLLAGSRCVACDAADFPARERCAVCGGSTEAAPFGRAGVVRHVTAVLHSAPGSLREAPYVVGLAEFADVGLAVLGVLAGATAVGDVELPTTVDTVATRLGDDSLTYSFAIRAGGR